MKYINIFLLSFTLSTTFWAQNYSSNSYQFNNAYQSGGANIVYKEDSLLVNLTYISVDILPDKYEQMLFMVDANDPKAYNYKIIDQGVSPYNSGYHNSMAMDGSGKLYITGAGWVGNVQVPVLTKAKANRTLEWAKVVGNGDNEYCSQPIVLNDNRLIYTHYYGEFSKFSNNELVWIDSMGNELKKVQMPQKDYIYNENPDVRLMPDSGFLMATHSYIY